MATVVPPKSHRHTRSAAIPPATASSQNPKNPHHLNSHAHTSNSESDMNHSTHPTTPPRTPRKEAQRSSHTKSNSTQETGSKQKPRNKRPKNVMTSPAATRNDCNTPPLTGAPSAGMPSSAKPISTPSTAAYAGPTFHASPAPSALPIPSFYSISVPESPGITKGIRSLKETSVSESPSRVPAALSNVQLQREESPLDIFFKADREEKARARSASSTQNAVPVTGPFQPPVESPRTSQTPPVPASQNRPCNTNRHSSSGMFAMELDGEGAPGTPYGPAFSTPYSERINAARTAGSQEQSTQGAQPTMTSEALKAYLFSGHQSPSPTVSSTGSGLDKAASSLTPTAAPLHRNVQSHGSGQRTTRASTRSQNNQIFAQDTSASSNTPRTSGRSSGLRQEVTPTRTPTKTPDRGVNYTSSPTPSRMYRNSTPSNTSDFIRRSTPNAPSPVPGSTSGAPPVNNHADIKGMEDSLRRILKLDSNPGVTGSGVSGMPAAAASVPNYVGGRPSPMNGMHNGVMGS